MLNIAVRYRAAGMSPIHTARSIQALSGKTARMIVRGLVLRMGTRGVRGPILLGRGARIRDHHLLRTYGRVIVEDYAEIHCLAADGVTLGRNVSIGSFAMIRPSGYYSREIGIGLTIGDDSSIGPYCYLGCSGGIVIGSSVMLGPGVRLFAENHVFDSTETTIKSQGVRRAPIVIQDDCWLASGVTVTAGVTVGAGSVVAAGSVVTKDVPPGSVVAGAPARVVRRRGAPPQHPNGSTA